MCREAQLSWPSMVQLHFGRASRLSSCMKIGAIGPVRELGPVFNIRFTIIDDNETISFVGPCHAIKMMAAACSAEPASIRGLLDRCKIYDPDLIESVLIGLAIFDEHNTPEYPESFHSAIETHPSSDLPPFRVIDEATKRASQIQAGSGLIIFNLRARRIIQVQNSYADVQRVDRGRVRRDGKPTTFLYHYKLPDEWRIVP